MLLGRSVACCRSLASRPFGVVLSSSSNNTRNGSFPSWQTRSSSSNNGGSDNQDGEKSAPSQAVKDPYGLEATDDPFDFHSAKAEGDDTPQLSARDQKLLNMTQEERMEEWKEHVQTELSTAAAQRKLARHVLSNEALKAKEVRAHHPERREWEALQQKYLKALEQKEKLMQKQFAKSHNQTPMTDKQKEYHKLLETHELHDSQLDGSEDPSLKDIPEEWAHPDQFPSNPWAAENLAWVAEDVNDGGMTNMEFMPPEILQGPNQKLNRRQATPIPSQLLHHNNLALLRTFVTPGGQIMPRSQTRLGAKDQRKVSKMVKRARAMGLIPYVGQWKVQDHGNVLDRQALQQPKEWEQVMEKAGLFDHLYSTQISKDQQKQLAEYGKELGLVEEDGSIPLKKEIYKLQAKLNNIQLVDNKKN